MQAAFDGERILVTNNLGKSVSLWKAADLTEIAPILLEEDGILSPYGVCSDGIGFLIAISNTSVVVKF